MLDFVVGTLLGIVLTIMTIDMVLYMIGYGTNDGASRDAARAAGTADSLAVATQAATMACASHKTDGFIVSQPQLDLTNFHFADDPKSPVPLVSTITYCDLKLPGTNFFSAQLVQGALAARRQYVFPALVLAQQPPILETVDMPSLILPSTVAIPITNGSIPGSGTSGSIGSSE